MGLLDDIFAGQTGASPWGALYAAPPTPDDLAKKQAEANFLRGISQNPYEGFGNPDAAPQAPSPFGPVPQVAPPPPQGFGAGAVPFGFAGPGSMSGISPSTLAPQPGPQPQAAPPQPSPQPAPAPVVASDQASPIGVGNYQMPRIGAADDFEPEDAPTDVSARARQPAAALAAASPAPFSLGGITGGIGDRLMKGTQGFIGNLHNGPIGAIAGGLGALITGNRTDPLGIANEYGNQTAQALVAKGASPADVIAAKNNPELMKALITQYYGKDKYKVQQTGEDGLGRKTFQLFNEADGTFKPISGAEGGGPTGGGPGGLGDMTKTGAAYIATVPAAQRGVLKGMLDGTIQPPTSFAASKPYWQTMIAAAKQADPNFDENNWAGRHKMTTDLASSGNSTMGGILSNGESSFKHLAEYAASAADQGNASHNFPLGGITAHGQNWVGNALGGSNTLGKVKAIADNLGKYGAESTKFYAGTGGGVEERLNALKEMNPVTNSGEEAAAYAEKEKSLMLDRLNTKFQEIRNTYGDADAQRIIAKHMPDVQANIAKIDASIAKLRGGTAAQGSPGAGAKPATVIQNGHSYTLQPDGSYK